MKALTFHGKHTIKFDDAKDPWLQADTDVIVKVNLCAICGSDLHVYHELEKGLDHGTPMGHEFMGEVVDAGRNVKGLKKGDRVMSPFSVSCGHCYYCHIGLSARCVSSQLFGWVEQGRGLAGAQAEYVRVPFAQGTLIKVPEEISDEHALLLGDIIPTGYYCAQRAEVKPGGAYAVVGCGPVGLMAIIAATQLGAEKIYAVDTVPERLAMAKRLGAVPINGLSGDAIGVIRDATENRGVDAVMEAVGSHSSVRLAYELVRPGGIISAVGVCNDAHIAFSPNDAYDKNLTFKTGRCPARSLMDTLIPIVQSRAFDFSSIITHRLPLSKGEMGYDIFANKKDHCLKVILTT
jgi:threonine dehydrogenase-like Zn-dependent dehydrogenase